MKTTKSIIVVLFVLLAAQIASAYYCPSTGRWLSRDPIGEPGFQVLQVAAQTTIAPTALPSPSRWISRDPLGKPGFMLATTGQQPEHANDFDEDEPTTTRRSRHEPERLNLYGFIRNDPHNRVDPLGLISFDRCNDQQQAEIGAAWNSVCQMVNDPKFQCCVGRSTFLQMFKRRCAWGNVKFKCRHNDEGLCPSVCAHAWQSLGIGRGVIVVCDHWADCGLSMKCLLAHEFSHVIGGDPTHGGITPKVEKCCTQQ
jgi:hypothetical protein